MMVWGCFTPSSVKSVCVLMASPISLLFENSNKPISSEHILSGGGGSRGGVPQGYKMC